MCGIVGVLGKVDRKLVAAVVEESRIRGLHHLGKYSVKTVELWHARYCTSGEEHQPIVKGKNAVVLNGVLHMGTKKEMEKQVGVKMFTDNDAELLLYFTPEALLDKLPNASIACVQVINGSQLIAYRNSKRPLWLIEGRGVSTVLLASTQDILRRAGADWKKAKQLEPNKLYRWSI